MADDIVERLRAEGSELADEAALEISWLRSRLASDEPDDLVRYWERRYRFELALADQLMDALASGVGAHEAMSRWEEVRHGQP